MQAKPPPAEAGNPGNAPLTAWSLIGVLWALPLTLLGLLLALPVLCFGAQVSWVPALRLAAIRAQPPALLIRGRVGDYLLARHPFGAMQAMAIGHLIIADRACVSRRLLVHEMVHVAQAARWGPLFPLAYGGASLVAVLRGKNVYWDNVFEVAARRAEQHA